MTLLTKILLSIGGIIIVMALAFIVYTQHQISARQLAIETQLVKQKDLIDNITRSQSEYASRVDIEKFIKDNNVNIKAIQNDLSKLEASLTAVNIVTVHSSGQVNNNIPSTGVGTANPNPITTHDPFGYLGKTQLLSLFEKFNTTSVPIGTVGFSAWQPSPWSLDIAPRTYKVVNVVGTDENQRMYVYNKFSVQVNDKSYDVKINTAETKQEFPEARWSFWNPRLFLGIDGGINIQKAKGEITPNIGIGVMSYGKYKNQPDFSVLQIGVGYGTISKNLQLNIMPAAYNVGKHLPLMNNAYIGPSIHVDTIGNVSIMAGVRVGL
jgi:hypothetical protein